MERKHFVYDCLQGNNFNKKAVGLKKNQIYQCAYSRNCFREAKEGAEEFAVLVLQGLVNRNEPTLYLEHDEYFGNVDYFNHGKPQCDAEFRRYYAQTREYEYLPVKSACEAIRFFLPALNGVFLYNEDDMNSAVVAINLSMLYGCLPIGNRYYAENFADKDYKIVDTIDVSAWSLQEVYSRLFEDVLPKCDLTGAYAMGYRYFRADHVLHPKFYIMGMDYAVMQKNFIFMLSCNERERGFYDYVITGNDDEFAIYEELLNRLQAPAAMQGWLDPEWRWAMTATWHGHFIYCTDWAANLSFHASVPPMQKPPYAINTHRKPTKLQNKVYITILANEGDTPKMVSQLYNNGWLGKRRGDYPVNWTINPTHAERFPSLLEYYVRTAKDNDFFSMCPNGCGYNVVRENDRLEEFLQYTRKVNQNLHFKTADLWYANMEQVKKYFQLMPEIKGILIEPHFEVPRGQVYSVAGKPVVRHVDRLYYWYTKGDLCTNCVIDKEKTRAFLETFYSKDAPAFVPIYGYESNMTDEWADFCDTLDPEKYEIVDAETFMELAAQVAKPFENTLLPAPTEHEFNDQSLFDRDAWVAYDGMAEFEWVKDGLKVRIPMNAQKKVAGFRSDILSSTAMDGQCSAMVAIRNVRLPKNANVLKVATSFMSEGSDWMFWTYGDYDGFGLTDKWEPFWKPSWVGERSEEVPRRVRNYFPNAQDCLILCVEGKPGDEIVFSELKFEE